MAERIPPPAHPDQFKDRVIIVAGAGGKLGRVICKALCESGAHVAANDINGETLSSLVSSLESDGGSIVSIALSAGNGEQIVSKTIEKFGAIHAVINATLGPIPWSPFQQTTDERFRDAFESNFLGPISLIRAAWPHFAAQKFGRVVNFTSDSMLGFPTASTYTFSKGALLGVNKTLAMVRHPGMRWLPRPFAEFLPGTKQRLRSRLGSSDSESLEIGPDCLGPDPSKFC